MRALVGVVGMAGHAFPAFALAQALHGRGHDVLVCSSERWRGMVEERSLRFDAHQALATPAERANGDTGPTLAEMTRSISAAVRDFGPDVVVSDALSAAPALAAEAEGVAWATLFPEVYPVSEPGLPLFSLGLVPPRTRLGAAAWRAIAPAIGNRLPTTRWLRPARARLNRARAELGLPPLEGLHGPLSDGLVLVATLPQLEYPRRWPAHVHVTGPMFFDPPHPAVELPAGEGPLVVVAASTVKDVDRELVRDALDSLRSEPVRVLVTLGGGRGAAIGPVPGNAVVVDWVSFDQVMPQASLVVCGGNHGTVARALAEGVPVLVSPAMPDDAEHGARVAWAGVGLMVPRWLRRPGSLQAAALRWRVRRARHRDRRLEPRQRRGRPRCRPGRALRGVGGRGGRRLTCAS
jgi:UDP:flavonoid glycosyltransferase YjiC (YdhE family)